MEIILDYPGGSSVIIRVLKSGTGWPKKDNRGHGTMRRSQFKVVDLEDDKMSHKSRNAGTSRSWKRQGNRFCQVFQDYSHADSLGLVKRNPFQTTDLQNNKFVVLPTFVVIWTAPIENSWVVRAHTHTHTDTPKREPTKKMQSYSLTDVFQYMVY